MHAVSGRSSHASHDALRVSSRNAAASLPVRAPHAAGGQMHKTCAPLAGTRVAGRRARSVPRRRPVTSAAQLRRGADVSQAVHHPPSSSSACTPSRSLGRVRALLLCQSHAVRRNLERLPHGGVPTGQAAAAPASACILSDGAFSNQHRSGTKAWSAWQPSPRKAPTASTRFLEACLLRPSPALTAASQFERMSAHTSPRRRVRRAPPLVSRRLPLLP
jgi:hypothetical protein